MRRRPADTAAPRPQVVLEAVITCPDCGGATREAMPTDACQWFYDCRHCGTILKPQPGDCCVFCSYSTTPCPPIQLGAECRESVTEPARGQAGAPAPVVAPAGPSTGGTVEGC